jgi:lysophospholipase L1-like esterase
MNFKNKETMVRNFFVFFIAALCIGVIITGHLHWNKNITAAGSEGKRIVEETLMKEKAEKDALIKSLDPKTNKGQSVMDFLKYKALTKDKVTISILGSDGTVGIGASHSSGTWPELLASSVRAEIPELKELQVMNHGHEGYTTSDLIKSGTVDDVIMDKPDFVIFETAILSNYSQSISLMQTTDEIERIVSSLQSSLPEAKILVISSNPIVNSQNRNSQSLSYLSYLNESKKKVEENKWSYINSVVEIEKKMEADNLLLADIMVSDNVHLNDKGYFLWYQVIFEFLRK